VCMRNFIFHLTIYHGFFFVRSVDRDCLHSFQWFCSIIRMYHNLFEQPLWLDIQAVSTFKSFLASRKKAILNIIVKCTFVHIVNAS